MTGEDAGDGNVENDDAENGGSASPREPVPVRAVEPEGHRNWVTRRRLAKWNAPPRRRNWRWAVSVTGRVLIATGVLLFGFVAYQLWGTGIETARAQRALANEFEDMLARANTTTTTAPPTTTTTAPPVTTPDDPEPEPEPAPEPEPEPEPGVDQQFPPIELGDALALLEIPRIGVEDVVVAGVGVNELRSGPGHFPETPLPGQLGNAALAGHRTTYGAPFRRVDRLEPGDQIIVTTVAGRFVYEVTGTRIVAPSEYQVVATTRPDVAEITLVSCHPEFTTRERIIVSGELIEELSDPVGRPIRYGLEQGPSELPGDELPGDEPSPETTVPATTEPDTTEPGTTEPESTEPGTTEPGTTEPTVPPTTAAPTPPSASPSDVDAALASSVEDAFGRGWFHDRDAWPHIALWGLLLSAISIGAYLLSRSVRRDLVGFVVGAAPFAVVAFFFFQNVNRLLPPAL